MKLKVGKQFRALGASKIEMDQEKRTIGFSFSSEMPVERYFGMEILSHAEGAADLSRLNDGGALLWNHDTNCLIGVVERAEIRDGKGYCEARFSSSPEAQKVMQDVMDGICRNVSFGYEVKKFALTKPEGNGSAPEYTAVKWAPFEVSFVSVPADPTVGVGRSAGDEQIDVPVIVEEKTKEKEEMEKETKIDIAAVKAEAMEQERKRIAEISAMGKKFAQDELARQLIEGGKSLEEARAAILDKLPAGAKPVTQNEAEIGMSEKEVREYSFARAIAALANPGDRKLQEAAKFEREVSEAAAQKAGKAARGLIVPVDVLRASGKRDMTVGTSTAGGNLVATELLSGSFIDILRNKAIVMQAGAKMLSGLVGNIAIPRQTGASSAYWVAESGAPTESALAFDQVTMSPKTLGAFVDYSRKLMLQAQSIDVEALIRSDLAQVIALEIDRAALYGSGSSNQPQGLKAKLAAYNTASQEKNFAAATPTFAEIVDLESKITALNVDTTGAKYIVNASMAGALKTKEKASGYPVYVLENGQMNGYQTLVSNQVASGDVWHGVWDQLMIGFWSGLDLMVDPYTGGTSGTVRVIALQDCDLAIRHEEAFSRGNDSP